MPRSSRRRFPVATALVLLSAGVLLASPLHAPVYALDASTVVQQQQQTDNASTGVLESTVSVPTTEPSASNLQTSDAASPADIIPAPSDAETNGQGAPEPVGLQQILDAMMQQQQQQPQEVQQPQDDQGQQQDDQGQQQDDQGQQPDAPMQDQRLGQITAAPQDPRPMDVSDEPNSVFMPPLRTHIMVLPVIHDTPQESTDRLADPSSVDVNNDGSNQLSDSGADNNNDNNDSNDNNNNDVTTSPDDNANPDDLSTLTVSVSRLEIDSTSDAPAPAASPTPTHPDSSTYPHAYSTLVWTFILGGLAMLLLLTAVYVVATHTAAVAFQRRNDLWRRRNEWETAAAGAAGARPGSKGTIAELGHKAMVV